MLDTIGNYLIALGNQFLTANELLNGQKKSIFGLGIAIGSAVVWYFK